MKEKSENERKNAVTRMLAACIAISILLLFVCVGFYIWKEIKIEKSATSAMEIINNLQPTNMSDAKQIQALMREAVEYYRTYMDHYKENSSSNLVALIYGLISTVFVGVLGTFVQKQKDRIEKLNEDFAKERDIQVKNFNQQIEFVRSNSDHRLKEFELFVKQKEFDMERRMGGFDKSVEEKRNVLEQLSAEITVQTERLSAVKAFDGIMQLTNQIMIYSAVLYGTISSDPKTDVNTINAPTVALRERFGKLSDSMEGNTSGWDDQMKELFTSNIIQAQRNLALIKRYANDPDCAYQKLTSDELLGYCQKYIDLLR